MSDNFTIVVVDEDGRKTPYFDAFTGKVYKSDERTAMTVAMMLLMQQGLKCEVEKL